MRPRPAVRFSARARQSRARALPVLFALTLCLALTGAAPARRPRVSPFTMKLLPGPKAPGATGRARLVYADSPFGVALTADGHEVYDLEVTAVNLPPAAALGAFGTYVAWAVTPDLAQWTRLGEVGEGTRTVGPVQLNKFLVVITAAASPSDTSHAGTMVLHGTSPSGWLQKFLTHPLFRGIPF